MTTLNSKEIIIGKKISKIYRSNPQYYQEYKYYNYYVVLNDKTSFKLHDCQQEEKIVLHFINVDFLLNDINASEDAITSAVCGLTIIDAGTSSSSGNMCLLLEYSRILLISSEFSFPIKEITIHLTSPGGDFIDFCPG